MRLTTVWSSTRNGRYAFASGGGAPLGVGSADEYSITLDRARGQPGRAHPPCADRAGGPHLRPGSAPKTASEFSGLHATCAFRKVRSCARNGARPSGYALLGWAARCHWAGERSRTRDRCAGGSAAILGGKAPEGRGGNGASWPPMSSAVGSHAAVIDGLSRRGVRPTQRTGRPAVQHRRHRGPCSGPWAAQAGCTAPSMRRRTNGAWAQSAQNGWLATWARR